MHINSQIPNRQIYDVVIFGAGPAGLTAGYELAKNFKNVLIFESDEKYVGGIARTPSYLNFKFDIGGHRFFTKSDVVKKLWSELLEPEYWLFDVPRLSRIYFNRKYFSYPLKAFEALFKLGVIKSIFFVSSFIFYQIYQIKNVKSFEDWVTNNFGKRLYMAFFKTYTEKVWGIPCNEISSDWAAQRIKGLSLNEAIINALKDLLPKKLMQKSKTIKTLIDKFDYPVHGPGMLWESATNKIVSFGGEIKMSSKVTRVNIKYKTAASCEVNNEIYEIRGYNFISTLPLKELIKIIKPSPPEEIVEASSKLKYRDFLTVVLILNKKDIFPDNWIYIHEPDVRLGRIQNFKNWSRSMVPNIDQTSLGLEYFCNEDDELWKMSDSDLVIYGLHEVAKIGLLDKKDFVDGTVVRMPKAYPVYDEDYKQNVHKIKDWLAENVKNLQLVGRNGMHMYNNQDHSMLAAYLAARNLLGEKWDPWLVNADAEYHEGGIRTSAGRLVPKKFTK